MRTSTASGVGIAIGTVVAAAIAYGVSLQRPRDDGRDDPVRPVVVAASEAVTTPPPVGPPPSQTHLVAPTPSPYGPPDEPPRIYRCRANGTTVYSNDPCPGGAVVERDSAVTGFDTRPSERLARLVAAGRAPADAVPAPIRGPVGVRANSGGPCAQMRRQIVDIDRTLRQPHSPGAFDDLRQTRQDIRTSMARDRC